jgi:hypothetical protein
VSKLKYDPTRWIWEDGWSLLDFFRCQKEKDGGSTQNATKQECIRRVAHGDPKFIQDEMGRHMVKGQSEKGSKINVNDVTSNDSCECVACWDQPRGSNNLLVLQPRHP